MTSQTVRISDIIRDQQLQPRAHLCSATIEDYAEALKAGAKFPPVEIWQTEEGLLLSSGFHRVAAYEMAGIDHVPAIITPGTRRAALRFALGENRTHGLRRSNEDKRRAVELAIQDSEWSTWSDSRIAELCGVSHTFVSNIRPQPATVASCDDKRIGKDGRRRAAPRPKLIRNAANADEVDAIERNGHADEPPDIPEPVEGEAEAPVRDGSGAIVPEAYREMFREGKELSRRFRRLSKEMADLLKEIVNHRYFAQIHKQSVESDLNNLKQQVYQYEAYGLCQYCKGKRTDCTGCNGFGYLNKLQFENSQKAMKTRIKQN